MNYGEFRYLEEVAQRHNFKLEPYSDGIKITLPRYFGYPNSCVVENEVAALNFMLGWEWGFTEGKAQRLAFDKKQKKTGAK